MAEYDMTKLSVELLGSPGVFYDGSPVQVNRKRVRALLFYLAAERKPVSRSRLAYMLWPDRDSISASKNLSIHISYLKNDLGDGIVDSTVDMISLSSLVSSDVKSFAQLSAKNDSDSLCAALKLCKGPFLDGFSLQKAPYFEQWSTETESFWQNYFVETAVRAAEMLTKEKKYEPALAVLEEARRKDPLQEAVCRQRMEILSLSGKRSSVSKVYFELVNQLSDELGVPPAPETAECYQRIISDDESTADSPQPQAEGTFYNNGELFFVGRREQLETLKRCKPGTFILIQGKSGLGKTRLVNEYSRLSGLKTISLAFRQREQDIPYSGFIKYIKSLVFSSDWDEVSKKIREQMHTDRYQTICRIIPELGLADESGGAFVTNTRHILESFEQFFFLLLDGSEALFFVDDIHYADSSSIELIQYLVSQPTMRKAKFVATFRQSLSSPAIIALFNTLQRENVLYTVNIGKMDKNSMEELFRHYFPGAGDDTVREMVELADGNPYWMKAIMSGLESGYSDFSGKASLIELFNRSLSALSPQALNIVYTLAIMGENCDAELFSSICAHSFSQEPGQIYSELFNANIITRDFDGSIKFSHSKIYEHVLALASANPRQLKSMHLVIAEAMQTVYGEDASGQRIISITEHYRLSSRPHSCGSFAFRSGNYLLAVGSMEQAVKYYKLAFAHLNAPENLNVILPLYKNLLQLGHNYEANIYLQNALSIAENGSLEEYALLLKAILELSSYPEFAEVHQGVFPSYVISIKDEIYEMLCEAEKILNNRGGNPFLRYNLLHVFSFYYSLTGQYDRAKECLWKIISENIISIEEKDVLTAVLTYSAIRDLIVIANQVKGSETMEIIALEEQVFKNVPTQSLHFTSIGTRALRLYIQGNREEGIRLMNSVISEARQYGSRGNLADSLVTQAMLIRHSNPAKSYSMNFEACTLAKQYNLRYSLVRALTGLVITCSSEKDAEDYYGQLKEIADEIGNDSIKVKLDIAEKALRAKRS